MNSRHSNAMWCAGAPAIHVARLIKACPKLRRFAGPCVAIALFCVFGSHAIAASADTPSVVKNDTLIGSSPLSLDQLSLTIKIIAGTLGAVATILGLPVALIQFRKTRAEIRKLDLEAEKLRREAGELQNQPKSDKEISGELKIDVSGDHNVISVISDPRLAGPLLVLIDFIIACMLFVVASPVLHALDIIGDAVGLVLAVVLFYPVFRTAKRVRVFLRDVTDGSAPGPEKM